MYNIHKFGGASVKNAQAIRQVASILVDQVKSQGIPALVVVSAMGRTTNKLEKVVDACYSEQPALAWLHEIIQWHHEVVDKLGLPETTHSKVNDVFVEGEWIIEDAGLDEFNYVYDQIVALGEIAASTILCEYLRAINLKTDFLDIRDIIKTDESFRQATVLWDPSQKALNQWWSTTSKQVDIVVTQGFIASTLDNRTTTLGREGSDFTAAILAYLFDAKTITIWKDVPGIMTADPNKIPSAQKLDQLSYLEAIEMTYYGAKVIHPKTIKPLQNKQIELIVKSFDSPQTNGTIINDHPIVEYPPIIITEDDQYLIKISTLDFTFVGEHHLATIFKLLADKHIKVNVMKNSAISFTVCVSGLKNTIEAFIEEIGNVYKIEAIPALKLITVRHYNHSVLKDLLSGAEVLFEEKSKSTIQYVVRPLDD